MIVVFFFFLTESGYCCFIVKDGKKKVFLFFSRVMFLRQRTWYTTTIHIFGSIYWIPRM